MSMLVLSTVKDHLNITDTAHDGELQAMIDAAEATIAKHVGPLSATTVTTRVSGGTSIILPIVPVLSLTSVTPTGGTALTVGDLTTDTAAGIVSTPSSGAFTSTSYDIVYQAGRTICPPDLKLAAMELVRHLWTTQRNPALFPGSALSDGPVSTPGMGYLMPYRVQELLAPHIQFGFA